MSSRRKTLLIVEIGFLLLFFLTGVGEPILISLFFALLLGWVGFLGRVVPAAIADWTAIGIGAVSLLGVTAAVHYLGSWLFREIRRRKRTEEANAARPWKLGWTLSIVGIVILMFVAGIAAIGMVHSFAWLKFYAEAERNRLRW